MNVRLEDLLRKAGLPQIRLDDQASFLPLRDVLALTEQAARVTGIKHFALMLASAEGLHALGDYGRYIKAAPSLLDAIRRAGRYISWHTLGASLSLRSEATMCVWRYDLPPAVHDLRQHGYPFALVVMREIVRLAAGRRWLPNELRLEQAKSAAYSRPLEEAFGPHIRWEATENALVFERSLLAAPLASAREERLDPASEAAAFALA